MLEKTRMLATMLSFQAGEDYVICVIATNNNVDSIGVRTTCGSMSFCGARGQRYPDARLMGYPFSNPITLNNQRVSFLYP